MSFYLSILITDDAGTPQGEPLAVCGYTTLNKAELVAEELRDTARNQEPPIFDPKTGRPLMLFTVTNPATGTERAR